MKIFQIIDEENALLAGILLYYEKAKTCIIELPEYLDEWTAPLLFASYVKKKIYTRYTFQEDRIHLFDPRRENRI